MPTYRDSQGNLFQTGNRLGGGGEAEVFTVSGRSDLIAKIYTKMTPDHDPKIGLMITNPPVDPCRNIGHTSIAWPRERLYHSNGGLAGYIMPAVHGAQLLFKAYHPTERSRTFPTFTWYHQYHIAINLVSAIAAIHSHGYVIGDINESNILISNRALITLIDTDSFQVQHYHCPVGKPEYTPPELQGKNFTTVHRTIEHDCFGLGVLIFQLLLEGNHPFRARWVGNGQPPAIQDKIKQGLFPYAHQGSRLIQPAPGVHFDMLHPAVADLMRRCFEDGHHTPQQRPKPADWYKALMLAKNDLKRCTTNAQHFYGAHQKKCPWCDRDQRRTQATQQIATLRPQQPIPPQQPLPQNPPIRPGTGPHAKKPTPPPAPNVLQRARTAIRQFEWRLLALWVVATMVSAFIGIVVVAMSNPFFVMGSTWIREMLIGISPQTFATETWGLAINNVIASATFGAVVGGGQWVVLRKQPKLREAGWWIPATALSLGLNVGLSTFSEAWLLGLGVMVGAGQWLVLRRSLQQTNGWFFGHVAATGAILTALIASATSGTTSGLMLIAISTLYPLSTGITLPLVLRQTAKTQPMRLSRPKPTGLAVWSIWLLMSVVGWMFGPNLGDIVFAKFINFTLAGYNSLLPLPFPYPSNTFMGSIYYLEYLGHFFTFSTHGNILIPALIGWATIGGFIGLSQWLVLRQHLQPNKWWIIASASGFALGMLGTNSVIQMWSVELYDFLGHSNLLLSGLYGLLVGFGIGCMQWMGLRRQFSDTRQWVVASSVGWGIAWAISPELGQRWLPFIPPFLLIGIISSAITGIALIRILPGLTALKPEIRSILKWLVVALVVILGLWFAQGY